MNTPNTLDERLVTEFELGYLCEWRWKREQPSKPSGGDFLRAAFAQIREDERASVLAWARSRITGKSTVRGTSYENALYDLIAHLTTPTGENEK